MMKEFKEILSAHRGRYPLMEPRDYGKLAFQSEFGPEHLVSDGDSVLRYLRQEYGQLEAGSPVVAPEPIGNGLCRFHLSACSEAKLPLLAEIFCRSAREHRGTRQGLAARLELLRELDVPGMEEWLAEYEASDCPALRHSQTYRDAYGPHYRVIKLDYIAELEG